MTVLKNPSTFISSCKVSIALVEDVSAINRLTDRYHLQVVFKSGKSWQDIYYTPGTGELSASLKETDAGILWEQTFKMSLPGDGETNLSKFNSLIDRPIVVKITYSDGTVRMLGNLRIPARLSSNFVINAKSSAIRSLTFSCLADDVLVFLIE